MAETHGNGINVSDPERAASVGVGATLALLGLRKRGLLGYVIAFAGGTLIYRGLTGQCDFYKKLGVGSRREMADVPGHGGVLVQHSVTVDASKEDVYAFWRDYGNLPKFMSHLESVTQLDDRTSRWVAKAPAGTHVQWDAETVRDEPGKLIAWRSLEGATVPNSGSVRFLDAPNGGTEVKVTLEYEPPGGAIGATVARLFGEEPQKQIEDDLGKFSALMGGKDASEMAQTAAQIGGNSDSGSEHTSPGAAPESGSLLPDASGDVPPQRNLNDAS